MNEELQLKNDGNSRMKDNEDWFKELMKNPDNRRIYEERVKLENEKGNVYILCKTDLGKAFDKLKSDL